MTAVVSRERARTTYLTAAAGMLLLTVAVVMMIVAAPGHLQARTHGPAKPSAVVLTTDECYQLTSNRSGTEPAGRPPAGRPWGPPCFSGSRRTPA